MMKGVFLYLLICVALPTVPLVAQSCIVHFYKIREVGKTDTINFPIVRMHSSLTGNDELTSEIVKVERSGDTVITTVRYDIQHPTCAIIGDGFSHEIVISPFDTVNIICQRYPEGSHFLKDSVRSPWNFKMSYGGKSQADFEVFDSLAYIGDLVHYSHPLFNPNTDSISDLLPKVMSQYQARIDFVEGYRMRHSLSPQAYKYVCAELKYVCLTSLIMPFTNPWLKGSPIGDMPKEYLNKLRQFDIQNEDLFDNTEFYSFYLQLYTDFFKGDFHADSTSILIIKRPGFSALIQTCKIKSLETILTWS